MIASLLLLLGLARAEEYVFYVAPVKVISYDKSIESIVDSNSPFTYTNSFAHNAKVKTERGIYEPILMHTDKLLIYSNDTIDLKWNNCDYDISAIACAVMNKHFYLETIVTVDENELAVSMVLYDKDGLVVGTSKVTDQKIVTWIKQQEVTSIQQQGRDGSTTTSTHVGLEKLPLKWEIPHKLLDDHMHQASLMLWAGIKIK